MVSSEGAEAPEIFFRGEVPEGRAVISANDPGRMKNLEAFVGAQQKNRTCGLSESFMRGRRPVRIYLLPERPAKRFSRTHDPEQTFQAEGDYIGIRCRRARAHELLQPRN